MRPYGVHPDDVPTPSEIALEDELHEQRMKQIFRDRRKDADHYPYDPAKDPF